MEIRAKCRRLKQKHDLKLVVIDYLQLMSSGKRVESRQQEVSEFSRALKLLAKELEVPVIAISQLNRGAEQRTDKRPQMSDLRESGSIEQDADIVILLHREDAYEKESPARRRGRRHRRQAPKRPDGHARRGVPGSLLALRGHAGLTVLLGSVGNESSSTLHKHRPMLHATVWSGVDHGCGAASDASPPRCRATGSFEYDQGPARQKPRFRFSGQAAWRELHRAGLEASCGCADPPAPR